MKWQILGNGPQHTNQVATQKYVVFNHGYLNLQSACRIVNQRLSHSDSALQVNGLPPFAGFAEVLNRKHNALQRELNAVPSSGLSCVMAFAEVDMTANVSGMTLLPNLKRLPGMPERKPMASYFHNWLAERRLALAHLSLFHWPQFYLAPQRHNESIAFNPYALLKTLSNLNKNDGLSIIRQLVRATPESWLQYDCPHDYDEVDAMFCLMRNNVESPNWWLFNDGASELMAWVQHQVAWAQQQRLLNLV